MRRLSAKHMLVTLGLTLILGYLAVLALAYCFQARLVYFPLRELQARPEAVGLHYEAVALHTSDGVNLSAWFVPCEGARGVVLFCHGNGGNISHRLDSLKILQEMRLATFIFDYRGYGESEGTPTERGTYLDAQAAWDYLVNERKTPPSQIVVFGESLGGSIAAWLAKENPPGALIVQSTFTSLPDLGARLYPFLPVRLISRFRYSTKQYLQQVTCPVLVMHSPSDEIVPFSHGRELFETAKGPKEFLELTGSHNDGFLLTGPSCRDAIASFISKHIRD